MLKLYGWNQNYNLITGIKKTLNAEDKIYISRTPLRVSFFGGGTDMPYFYEKYGGNTINTTIKKYVYVVVKRHNNFQEKV